MLRTSPIRGAPSSPRRLIPLVDAMTALDRRVADPGAKKEQGKAEPEEALSLKKE